MVDEFLGLLFDQRLGQVGCGHAAKPAANAESIMPPAASRSNVGRSLISDVLEVADPVSILLSSTSLSSFPYSLTHFERSAFAEMRLLAEIQLTSFTDLCNFSKC
ncbi:hypothetical protein [Mesorhizobium tianshanense]|uniref:hypothetical protein n=1 Tax=Mesorhizobium tianshanense TaxID=39844 RepID=UPI0011A797B2|nr:hypothetical protein [Mesorhizobium tianshanense]